MSEPQILVALSALTAVSHAALFHLLFEDFGPRLDLFQTFQRRSMVAENQEFVSSMSGVIEVDPEAAEVVGFGEQWRRKLTFIDSLHDQRQALSLSIANVYYVLIISIFLAAIGQIYPMGVTLPYRGTIYFTSLSWWLLLAGLLLMLYYLFQYQSLDDTLTGSHDYQESFRGAPIPAGGFDIPDIQRVVASLKERLIQALRFD